MVYLDNAATSFPKPASVVKETLKCIKRYCGNPGRSSHKLSLLAAEKIYECREKIAQLINIGNPERIIFTYNATYALNIAIKTTVPCGSHIVVSDLEHNSVIRPIEALKDMCGVRCSFFSTEGNDEQLKRGIKSVINENTTAIVCTLASNVTGKRIPLKTLSGVAKECKVKLIVDASQFIGHDNIDLSKYPCDVLCAPGHKALFGIQGCGFAVFCDGMERKSFIEGGSGSSSASKHMPNYLPDRFEAGTPATPSIASLCEGVKYLMAVGVDEIKEKLDFLCERTKEFMNEIPNITLYGAENGIISFNLGELPSSFVSERLNKYGICTRGGLHCAPSVHKLLGTENQGCVRASFSFLNSVSEAEKLYFALKDISKNNH